MVYRVVLETERDNRKGQLVHKVGTNDYGVKRLVKDANDYFNLGIDWVGTEDIARKKLNQFTRGN